jgi:hypothetical protein
MAKLKGGVITLECFLESTALLLAWQRAGSVSLYHQFGVQACMHMLTFTAMASSISSRHLPTS